MVSQADLDLIQNFAVELQPFIDTVLAGTQEYERSQRDTLVIGQAVQSLGMIRGAGSILMVDPLVQIADMLSEAFELLQANQRRATEAAVEHLHALTGTLQTCLDSMTAGKDTAPTVDDAKRHLADLMRAVVETDRLDPLVVAPFYNDEPARTPPAPAVKPVVVRNELQHQPPPDQDIPPLSEFQGADDALDSDVLEAFQREAAGLAASFRNSTIALSRSPADRDLVAALRNDARSLKDVANANGYQLIGQVGVAVEKLLDRYIDQGCPVDHDALELALVCWKMLPAMLKKLDDLTLFTAPVASIARRSEELISRFDHHEGESTPGVPATHVEPEPRLRSHLQVVPDYLDQFARPARPQGLDIGPPPVLDPRPAGVAQSPAVSPALQDELRLLVRELVASQTEIEQRLERLSVEQHELVHLAERLRNSSHMQGSTLSHDRLMRELADLSAAIDVSANDLDRVRSNLEAVSARQRQMTTTLRAALRDAGLATTSSTPMPD